MQSWVTQEIYQRGNNMQEVRCKKCNKLLGYINGDYEIKCPRCGEMNVRKENVKDEVGEELYKGKTSQG